MLYLLLLYYITIYVGYNYREKYLKICCTSCNTICKRSDHVQPYHVMMYVRLSNLWMNGGIFSDFSFLFLDIIPSTVIKYVSYI